MNTLTLIFSIIFGFLIIAILAYSMDKMERKLITTQRMLQDLSEAVILDKKDKRNLAEEALKYLGK